MKTRPLTRIEKILMVLCVASVIASYGIGVSVGIQSGKTQTNEQYYSGILADTFPTQNGSFVHIYLKNGTYYVYHNINESDWVSRFNNTSSHLWYFYYDATNQCWNNHAIFFRR